MDRYMVFVANTIDSSFDTLEEAENRVAEIRSAYPFVDPDAIHITRYNI